MERTPELATALAVTCWLPRERIRLRPLHETPTITSPSRERRPNLTPSARAWSKTWIAFGVRRLRPKILNVSIDNSSSVIP